jgi:hypothetical protein
VLAGRRYLKLDGKEIERTPLLVPSFSSKGFPEIRKILETAEEFIEVPILVSAYDIFYRHIPVPDWPPLIFLDSGGYEASKDADLSDLGEHEHVPAAWSLAAYNEVIGNWRSSVPTVVISYDHPNERLPIKDQITRARNASLDGRRMFRGLLLKPETAEQRFLHIPSMINNIHAFAEFDVIGFTEKEIGNSILDRMKNIAKVRRELERAGLGLPIQIFGSLDTMTTPLYFVAGADIFDGLTWLRFGFKDGHTLYRQNYGVLALSIDTKWHLVDARCWSNNCYYLKDLQLEMRRFLKDGDFSAFRHHNSLIRDAYNNVAEALGV